MPKVEDVCHRLEAFYAPLAHSKNQARRVGWESDAAHLVRLRAIVESLSPLEDINQVIDVGCGEGRLLAVLKAKGYKGRYRGEDILADMLTRAAHAHPEAEFVCTNSMQEKGAGDAIVCSGALNTPLSEMHQRDAEHALERLWERTSTVLVLDFSVHSPTQKDESLARLDLTQMWRKAKALTPLVNVREDLIAGEAMLTLKRSRRTTLEALLPEEHWSLDRARMLLAAREAHAVRRTLEGVTLDEADLWRGLADLLTGRARDAEKRLGALVSHPEHRGRAHLHLALVLLATHRTQEAEVMLRKASECSCSAADEARVVLAERAQRGGRGAEAAQWIAAIEDPWIKRELSKP